MVAGAQQGDGAVSGADVAGPALTLGTREQFDAVVRAMVARFAPRVFAIVQEYGDRVDARVVAWGMAHEDHADLVTSGGDVFRGWDSPEEALVAFAWGEGITPRVVWVDPDAAMPERVDYGAA